MQYKVKESLTKEMFTHTKWNQSEWTVEQKTMWQEAMFALGFGWYENTPSYLDSGYFFLGEDSSMTHIPSVYVDLFKKVSEKEKHFSDVFDTIEDEETSTDDVLIINEERLAQHAHTSTCQDASAFTESKKSVLEEVGLFENTQKPIKSDGGVSKYYEVVLPQWLLDKHSEQGFIMLEDLAEVMFGNDFNFTNVFKAQKRMFDMQLGGGKEGNTFEYDANKVKYYTDKQVEVFNRK